MNDFCDLYEREPDSSMESFLDYVDEMEKVGTPRDIPDDARDGFEHQITLVRAADDLAEALENYSSLSGTAKANDDAFTRYATSKCS